MDEYKDIEYKLKQMHDEEENGKKVQVSKSKVSTFFAVVFYIVGIALIFIAVLFLLDLEKYPRHITEYFAKTVVYSVLGVGSMIFARLCH